MILILITHYTEDNVNGCEKRKNRSESRFDCILSDTKDAVLKKYEEVKNLPMKDVLLRKASGYDFYNTSKYTFERLMDDPDHIEENFRDYLNGFSSNVQDILEKFKFDSHITTMANKGILYIV